MVSQIDATWGIWMVTAIVLPFLYGVGVLQAFLYFQWYPKDPWGTKAVIIALCVLETLQITLFERATYYYFVDGITSPENFLYLKWEDSAELLCMYLVATLVQGYFAHSIWRLNKSERKNIFVVIVICLFGLVSIVAGIVQSAKVFRLKLWSELPSTKNVTSVQSGFALGCDVLITISLCVTLHSGRRHVRAIQPTNALVNKLIIYAVNRGILTTVCAAVNLILFLAIPNTFWFFLGLLPSSKFYMNSLLAALNSRQYVRGVAITAAADSGSYPMSGATLPKFANNPNPPRGTRPFSTDLAQARSEDNLDLQFKPAPL